MDACPAGARAGSARLDMCPLCMSSVSVAERNLLTHLLAGHPVELALLTCVLGLAHAKLARRPVDLLAMDLAVLVAGATLSRSR